MDELIMTIENVPQNLMHCSKSHDLVVLLDLGRVSLDMFTSPPLLV